MTAMMEAEIVTTAEDCVALVIDWDSARIIDPATLLSNRDDGWARHVYSVPVALANEYIALDKRVREMAEQIRALPRYRIVPATKLVLGDATVAEKTSESTP